MYKITHLHGLHQKESFDCGQVALNLYLRNQAGQDVRRSVSAVFALTDKNGFAVLGYYTLCSTTIQIKDLPANIAKKMPKYTLLPATLLGRLAIDQKHQGQGLGRYLLFNAFERAFYSTRDVGSIGLVVNAKDEAAIYFYTKNNFVAYPESRDQLFLPMSSIERVILFDNPS